MPQMPALLRLVARNVRYGGGLSGLPGKGRWAQGLGLPRRGETLLFAGCAWQFLNALKASVGMLRRLGFDRMERLAGLCTGMGINPFGLLRRRERRGTAILRRAVELLRGCGVEPAFLADGEPCCGGVLWQLGMHSEFVEQANRAYRILKDSGARRLISLVPSCTYTLKVLYPQVVDGFDLEVRHWLELPLEVSPRVPAALRGKAAVYHDPCILSRYLRLVREPRALLQQMPLNLREAERHGEWSTCCGGGGGFELLFPRMAHLLAVSRVEELRATGAELAITCCPGCLIQLEAAGMRTLDLLELL